MTYLITRLILFFVILCIEAVFLILLRKKLSLSGKIIISVCTFLLLIFVALVPVEAPFLRFNSIEDAVQYRMPNAKILKEFDSEKCTFIIYKVDHQPEGFSSINKYGDQFGMADESTIVRAFKVKPKRNAHVFVRFMPYSVYNKFADESLVFIQQTYAESAADIVTIVNAENQKYEQILDKQKGKGSFYNSFSSENYKIEPYEVKKGYFVYLKDAKDLQEEKFVFE